VIRPRRWLVTCAGALLAALHAPPARAGLVDLGPEARLDVEASGAPFSTAAATAADGRSVVAWVHAVPAPSLGAYSLSIRHLDAAGAPEGETIGIDVSTRLGAGSPDVRVAAGHDESFLVAWDQDRAFRGRLLSTGGTLGAETEIFPAMEGETPSIVGAVAADPRGGFVAAFLSGSTERSLLWRRLDALGQPVGPIRTVAVASEVDSLGPPRVSVGASGGVVVVWAAEAREDNTLHREVHGRWFGPSAEPLGPVKVLGRRSNGEGVAIVHPAGDEALVAWEVNLGIALRRYDAQGDPGGERDLDLTGSTQVHQREDRIELAPLADGGALVAWVLERNRDPYLGSLVVDASNAPAGEIFRVSDINPDGAERPCLASDGESRVVACWRAGQFEAGVYARPIRVFTAGALSVAEPTYRETEGDRTVHVTVRRTGFAEGAVAVDYRTEAGSATAGEDFEAVSGTLSWGDGDRSSRTVQVRLLADAALEAPEVLDLVLSDPTGGAVLGSPSAAHMVIEDDDSPAYPGGAPAPLSASQVTCDRNRLSSLLERIDLDAPHSSKDAGLSLSLTASGDFAGIAYTANGPTGEHHLAFSTDPEVTTLLLNPERLQLPAVALVRNRVNSDLVPSGDPGSLELSLRPTLGDGPSEGELVIDNVEAGSASQVKPGRGLAALLAPCHRGVLAERDEHVLRVLSKLVRLEADGATRSEIAILRGEAIDSYRIDAYALAADGRALGRLAAELTVIYDDTGALQEGELRLLPPCAGGACTTLDGAGRLLLVRPAFSGEIPGPTPYVVATPAGPGGDAVAVDWRDLLDATTWRRPL
jgi:hypothetical protein